MAPLKKLDVIIRGNSKISQDDAIKWTKNWLNERQKSENNKTDFFADLYDSRDNSLWKVFSDVATKNRDIQNYYITKDNERIYGVITSFSPQMIKELSNNYEIKTFQLAENPYEYKGNYKVILAETDNEMAEIRILDNKIYIYDAGAFAETKQLLDIKKYPTKIKLIIFK